MSQNPVPSIEQTHREASLGRSGEKPDENQRMEPGHPETIEAPGRADPGSHDYSTIPYTELPAGNPDSPLAADWNFYRREVGRLLALGHENRWVLIKGEVIVGIFDAEDDARAVALREFLLQPCLIHQVRRREPVVRMSARYWACQG
jgi:hypothetical protein